MPRFPAAVWRGPIPNRTEGGLRRPILGLVLHIEQGSETGTDAWFHNPAAQVSAHFGNPKTGPLDQWVDTTDLAWAQGAGNQRWVSIENEGHAGDQLTDSQLSNIALLLAWLHKTEGVPLEITNDVDGAGLGWHGMGGDAWGGHTSCPGGPIVNQRPEIIRRALALTDQEDDMPLTITVTDPTTAGTWTCRVSDGAVFADAGAPFLGGYNGHADWGPKEPVADFALWKDDAGKWGYKVITAGADALHFYRFPRSGVLA